MRRYPDPQHLWWQSFCSCRSRAMEQFTAESQRCWFTVQSVPAVTLLRCNVNYFNFAVWSYLLTYLLTYLLIGKAKSRFDFNCDSTIKFKRWFKLCRSRRSIIIFFSLSTQSAHIDNWALKWRKTRRHRNDSSLEVCTLHQFFEFQLIAVYTNKMHNPKHDIIGTKGSSRVTLFYFQWLF